MQLSPVNHEPECPIAINLLNKLSAVIGHCDLLVDETPEDSPILQKMLVIRRIAKSMAEDLTEFQCDLVKRRLTNNRGAAS